MLQAVLAGLVLGICKMDMFFGYCYLSRPLVASTLMGLALGNVTQGSLSGAFLRLFLLVRFQ